MSVIRFQAGCLACVFTGLAMRASAQSDFLSPGGSSSMDTFGGDPDSYGFIRIPSDTDDWTRHFRIGAMVGMNISANFSEKGTFNISDKNLANGIYNDGYVRVDSSGNAFGQTSYWGYNNANQYNPAGNGTISMHSVTSYTLTGADSSKENGGAFPGFEMAYGDNLWYWKHARVGWELGVDILPISIKNTSSMTATVNQSTYTFDAGGIVVPTAPYQGGFNRQGGEPTISDNRSQPSETQLQNQTVIGTRTLNVMLYTVRLGPSFYWDLTEDFGMSLGAGPAIGIASERLDYNETITLTDGSISHNKGSINGTDVVFGGYVNGVLTYHVLDNADIYLGAQYMPLGNASLNGGGRQAELKLGGQINVSIGVNWPF
ncbi:MAG TPA: hypothetical protein VHY30_08275 [Verrucomicrobiae bacterium]|nr:hypothetical protein [Verrucomicrobiae bacterium]